MKLAGILQDERGTTAIEFALTAPAFFAFIFGISACGMLFWTQVGLQHGVEMAARCASINSTLCPTSNPDAILNYAAQQTLGLNPPISTFTYSAPACGNQVNAIYTFQFFELLNVGPLTLTAKACFPAQQRRSPADVRFCPRSKSA